VDVPPQDTAARREELERWADEQRRRLPEHGGRARLRDRLALQRRLLDRRLELAAQSADRRLERLGDRLFDRNLDTSGSVHLHDFLRDDRVHYIPSAWHVLPRALRQIEVSSRDTFLEFGCGKGRVLHQAARRPFLRVIGVEVSPDLAELARAGIAARRHRHRCRDVEIVVADAVTFRVPDDVTVGYFFRPFGDDTLVHVLRNIVESMDRRPRPVTLIYVWPQDRTRSEILATERFRLAKEVPSGIFNRRSAPISIFESR
jgi:SAM-dependent methyltransferase